MRWKGLLLVAGLMMLAAPVAGQALLSGDRLPDGSPAITVKHQRVSVEVDNQVARTEIEQVFVCKADRDLEAVYYFPLPDSASIHEFAYWANGERIAGEIREKDEARRTYERIVSQQKDPAILERVARNLFRARIYPVSSKEPTKVVLKYSEVLPYDDGEIAYRYPLASGGHAQRLGELTVVANVRDQKPIAKVFGTSGHNLAIAHRDEHTARVSFEDTDITPDEDFEFVYRVSSKDFGVSFLAHRPTSEPGYFMMIVAPQEETKEGDIVRKDVVFVFDKSGSMRGEKIEQAKEAFKFCAHSLAASDRFNIVAFSDSLAMFRDGLVEASRKSVDAACEFIDATKAAGGTNINEALLEALAMIKDSSAQRTVIFLTDGKPTVGVKDVGEIIGNVKQGNKHDARLFAFGVGKDVDDFLLLKLATDHRGAETHVAPKESIERKVSSWYAKVSKPVLVDLKIDWGKARAEDVYPARLPDVFKGSQLILTGRYRKPGDETIVMRGEINGRERVFEYPATFPEREEESTFVARLWAKDRIDYLVEEMKLHGEEQELKDEVVALSKEYVLQSPYTSFLAVPKHILVQQERERRRLAEARQTLLGAVQQNRLEDRMAVATPTPTTAAPRAPTAAQAPDRAAAMMPGMPGAAPDTGAGMMPGGMGGMGGGGRAGGRLTDALGQDMEPAAAYLPNNALVDLRAAAGKDVTGKPDLDLYSTEAQAPVAGARFHAGREVARQAAMMPGMAATEEAAALPRKEGLPRVAAGSFRLFGPGMAPHRGDTGAAGAAGPAGPAGAAGPDDYRGKDAVMDPREAQAIAAKLLHEFGDEIAQVQRDLDDARDHADDHEDRVSFLEELGQKPSVTGWRDYRLGMSGAAGDRKPSVVIEWPAVASAEGEQLRAERPAAPPGADPTRDVPLRHWAYDGAQKLVDAGVIIGYPDDTFKGGRAMTRYEFAAAVCRFVDSMLGVVHRLSVTLPARAASVTIAVDGAAPEPLQTEDGRLWYGVFLFTAQGPRASHALKLRIEYADGVRAVVWRTRTEPQAGGKVDLAVTAEALSEGTTIELGAVPGATEMIAPTASEGRRTWRALGVSPQGTQLTLPLVVRTPEGEAAIEVRLQLE